MAAGRTIKNIAESDPALWSGLRHVAPWVLGFFIMPLAIFFFRLMWGDSPWLLLVVVLLAAATGWLTWLVYKKSHGRRTTLAKYFTPGCTAAAMGFFTIAVAFGMPNIPDDPLFIVWVIGTPTLCISWNAYFKYRHDDAAAVVEVVLSKQDKKAKPALTAAPAAPAITAELAKPEQVSQDPQTVKALQAVAERKAEIEAKAANEAARKNIERVVEGWNRLIQNGATLDHFVNTRLRVVRSDDYATDVKMRLTDGNDPASLERGRGALATEFRVGKPDVRVIPNPRDNGDVMLRVVWYNPLDQPVLWPGPEHPGKSFGEAPITFAVREDNTPGRMLLPQSEKFGKNSSHVLVEGMNGAGKSETMLVVVGEGSTRPDVVFWAIDVAKGLQTFKSVLPALDWLVTDRVVAKMVAKTLVENIIPARGTRLANLGYSSGWVPECWTKHRIPYLVLIVEEGGIIFEAMGKRFVEVMMLARSVGICIWGSLQRAHHEMIDTNARAQFSEVLTFGMASDEDVFGMPEEMLDMGASPQQWRNRNPGMHYHYTPLLADEELVTPQRSFRAPLKMLRQVTEEWGPRMARPEPGLIQDADRLKDVYSNRQTGLDVERAMLAQGGVPLDQAAAGGEAAAPAAEQEPQRERIVIPPQRRARVIDVDMPEHIPATQPVQAVDDFDDDVDEHDEYNNDNEGGVEPQEGEVVYVAGRDGEPDMVIVDGEAEELEDLDDDDFDEEDFFDDEIPVPEDTPEMREVGGSADDEYAATAQEQDFADVLVFGDDEDWEPAANKEEAKRNLLRVLAEMEPGTAFQTGDIYDHPQIPYVNRSKSWLRGAVIDLAEAGVYVELIDDPSDPNDGKYRTTDRLRLERRALTPVS